jgi:hypothetical protein
MIPRDIKSSAVKVTGSTPDDVQYESVLEENFLFMVRFDQDVERYERYKGSIIWIDKHGQERQYSPDFEITYRQTKTGQRRRNRVVEVKPELIKNPFDHRSNLPRKETAIENRQKWQAAKKQLSLRGKDFVVIRSSEIETVFLENIKFLLMYLDHPIPSTHASIFTDLLQRNGPLTLRIILAKLRLDRQKRAELLPTLYSLIAERKVIADLSRILCLDTVLALP